MSLKGWCESHFEAVLHDPDRMRHEPEGVVRIPPEVSLTEGGFGIIGG